MPEYKKAEDQIFERLKNELPTTLYYHGYIHTEDVMKAAMKIAGEENISEEDKQLLRVAVAFHDAGFIYVYKNHEMKSCEMAREALPALNFSTEEINKICGMIMATKIPQQPTNLLEQIIADADLDYLGGDHAESIAATLFDELKHYAKLNDETEWNNLQISFLSEHHYFTNYSIRHRAPKKLQYLNKLIENKEE
jgi:predicted metal-dependent HD superfamily phosphohydrolase